MVILWDIFLSVAASNVRIRKMIVTYTRQKKTGYHEKEVH